MTLLVVDANVVIKWFVPEDDREAALALRASATRFATPDLMFVESANILWKLVNRGEIEPDQALDVIDRIAAVPFMVHTNRSLAHDALNLAHATGLSAYDASYVALAVRLDSICVTADQRLVRKLVGTSSFAHVRLLADYTN